MKNRKKKPKTVSEPKKKEDKLQVKHKTKKDKKIKTISIFILKIIIFFIFLLWYIKMTVGNKLAPPPLFGDFWVALNLVKYGNLI